MMIVGHCRFSYFGLTDTGREILTEDDAHQKLWTDERMNARFHLFENLLLPSIRAQTDPHFSLVILTSEKMPDRFHRRLAEATRDVPQIAILRTESTSANRVLGEVIHEANDKGRKPSVNFRVDDDDAFSIDYVEKLREASERLPLGSLISFPRGLMAFSDVPSPRCCMEQKTWIAIGLATINAPDDRRNPFWMQHRRAHRSRPSYLDPRFFAYIHTLHAFNNTGGYDPNNRPGPERRAIQRAKETWPELNTESFTEEAREALKQSFPFITEEKLLQTLTSR